MGDGKWLRRARRRIEGGLRAGGKAKHRGACTSRLLARSLSVEQLEDRRMLATFIVTNLADLDPDDEVTPGSLRDAVNAANDDDEDADIILFADGLAGTIFLNDGQLDIEGPVRILGPAAQKITIQADLDSRIFDIDILDDDQLRSAEISGLTLTGGNPEGDEIEDRRGGLIRNKENLLINDAILTGGTAAGGGGAIHHDFGYLQISRSLITNNSAGNIGGGAIMFGNTEDQADDEQFPSGLIADTTISGNAATSGAEGSGYGGGVLVRKGFVTISNSTIYLNEVANLVNNATGIASWGNTAAPEPEEGEEPEDPPPPLAGTTVISCIVYSFIDPTEEGNETLWDIAVVGPPTEAEGEGDPVPLLNSIENLGFNDIGVYGNLVEMADGDISEDPLLLSGLQGEPLYWGGNMPTFLPDQGSPVIDAGTVGPGLNFHDQRGRHFIRAWDPVAGHSGEGIADIGAAEVQDGLFIVDYIFDETDGVFSDVSTFSQDAYISGDFAIREALDFSAANPNVDTIMFVDFRGGVDPTISPAPTIRLTLGTHLEVNHSVNIIGPDTYVLEIDASGNDLTPLVHDSQGSRVFNIDDGEADSLQNVLITNLAMIGGDTDGSGGGVFSRENLNMSTVTLNDNNASARGGGVFIEFGNMTVTNSTISNNRAADSGGGVYIDPGVTNPTVLLSQVTISGNLGVNRGGGIYNDNGTLTIEYSTITNNTAAINGTGIANTSTQQNPTVSTTIKSSIISANGPSALPRDIHFFNSNQGIPISGTSFVSLGYNFIGGGNGISQFNQPGDQINKHLPMLAPLVRTGGLTATHRPLPLSPLIDAGDPAAVAGQDGVPDLDQRGQGFVRVFDGDMNGTTIIDIGAYELQPTVLIVDNPGDDSNGDFSVGNLTLREAIEISNNNPLPDEITFDLGISLITVGGLSATTLTITDHVKIVGHGSNDLAIQAAQVPVEQLILADKIFTVDNGLASLINVEISGMELRNAQVGAVLSRENLTLTDVTLIANSNAVVGGALYHETGNFKFANSLVTGNRTTAVNAKGGALYFRNVNNGAKIEFDYTTISGNTTSQAGAHGGALYVKNSVLEARQSAISGNATLGGASDGGGAFIDGSTVLFEESAISGNTTVGSGSEGAGLAIAGASNVTLTKDSTLALNVSLGTQSPGAGAFVFGGALTIENSRVVLNETHGLTSPGGALAVQSGSLTILGTTLLQNKARGNGSHGGAIANLGGTLLVRDSTLLENSVLHANSKGGAVYSDTNLTTQLTSIINSTVSGNSAPLRGGGVFNADGRLEIKHSTITNNSVPFFNVGSGVASQGTASTVTTVFSSIIAGNVGAATGMGSDVDSVDGAFVNSFVSQGYNVIGIGNALSSFNQMGDKTGITNPLLGLLAPNGGLTLTHALLPGSPAINSGSPEASPIGYTPALTFDQRGPGHPRVLGGRMDAGSFESMITAFTADFDSDNDVDGTDFLRWQRGLGKIDAGQGDGDSNGDGLVTVLDLNAWKAQYGSVGAVAAAASAASSGAGQSVIVASANAESAAAEEPTAELAASGRVDALAAAGTPGAAARAAYRPPSTRRAAKPEAAVALRHAAFDNWAAPDEAEDAASELPDGDDDAADLSSEDAVFALLGDGAL